MATFDVGGSVVKSSTPSPSPSRWLDLTHPIVAGLISVIVNYGGTLILVFQAAK